MHSLHSVEKYWCTCIICSFSRDLSSPHVAYAKGTNLHSLVPSQQLLSLVPLEQNAITRAAYFLTANPFVLTILLLATPKKSAIGFCKQTVAASSTAGGQYELAHLDKRTGTESPERMPNLLTQSTTTGSP